jgi:hypothetical protein
MSLRGSGTTEAISQHTENKEIAALLSVARNDDVELLDSPMIRRGCTWEINNGLYYRQGCERAQP